ncbi:UxaA family hydrolase, partial [Asticcacaulis sp. DXS10W]
MLKGYLRPDGRLEGYLRSDGRKGIRNVIAVAYLVECAHHVARQIVTKSDDSEVHLIGFPGCYPNDYAFKVMSAVTTHPNVGGVLLISLGCESFNRERLKAAIEASGRPCETLVIQQSGGTLSTIQKGLEAVARLQAVAAQTPVVEMAVSELVIGTICGGSDGTS